ncbi:hypothetical protein ACNKHT_18735 [Shigella flexneri]
MLNQQEWQQLAKKELSRRRKLSLPVQQTAEGIAIKPLYTEADSIIWRRQVPFLVRRLRSWPACHYVYRPTVDHPSYAGFSTAKETNAFIAVTLLLG